MTDVVKDMRREAFAAGELWKWREKAEKLAHYARRGPKSFVQIDGWRAGAWIGDSLKDKDGHAVTGGRTVELMRGADVRVLIDPSTTPAEATALLRKAAAWVEAGAIARLGDPTDDGELP